MVQTPPGGRHVCIHQDADRLAMVHRREQAARKVVLVQNTIAMQAADAVHQPVHALIVQATDHHAHGMAHERMVEAGELPGAEVSGHYKHAPALLLRCEIVLQPW